jgi:hypothetical protein
MPGRQHVSGEDGGVARCWSGRCCPFNLLQVGKQSRLAWYVSGVAARYGRRVCQMDCAIFACVYPEKALG